MTPETVLALRDENRLDELVAALTTLTDKERRALSGTILKRCEYRNWGQAAAGHCLAVMGCVTGVKQVARTVQFMDLSSEGGDRVADVLAARKPPWFADLPAELLKTQNGGCAYTIVRALVRAGLIAPPTSPDYTRHMVFGVTPFHSWARTEPSVLDELRREPTLLITEVNCLRGNPRSAAFRAERGMITFSHPGRRAILRGVDPGFGPACRHQARAGSRPTSNLAANLVARYSTFRPIMESVE